MPFIFIFVQIFFHRTYVCKYSTRSTCTISTYIPIMKIRSQTQMLSLWSHNFNIRSHTFKVRLLLDTHWTQTLDEVDWCHSCNGHYQSTKCNTNIYIFKRDVRQSKQTIWCHTIKTTSRGWRYNICGRLCTIIITMGSKS